MIGFVSVADRTQVLRGEPPNLETGYFQVSGGEEEHERGTQFLLTSDWPAPFRCL